MNKSFAQKQIGRICRRAAMTSLLWLAILAAALYFLSPHVLNLYFKQDLPIDADALAVRLDTKLVCVDMAVDELFYTGYDMTSDGKTSSKYYAYYDGTRYVLCEMPKDMLLDEIENYRLKGIIQAFESIDKQVITELAKDIASANNISVEQARAQLATVKINGKASILFRQAFTGAIIVLAVLCVVRFFRSLYLMANYQKHKVFQKLSLGEGWPAERVDEQVSHELEGTLVFDKKPLKMTQNWIVMPASNALTVRRREDLVWGHGHVTRHYTNGIPTGKTHSVSLKFKDGLDLSLPTRNEKDTEATMAALRAVMPKMLTGYSDELLKLFQSDKPGFLALCDQVYARSLEQERVSETEE